MQTAHNLRSVAVALGGDVISNRYVLCPGPGHSHSDRSLKVKFKPDGTFSVTSFADDDWRECKDYIRERLGLPNDCRRAPANDNMPGVPPKLDQSDVCLLLATLMSAPKLHEAVNHARAYLAMTPSGAILSADAPDSIPRSALEFLEVKSEIALGGTRDAVDDVRGHRFEFVHGWREFSAHTPEGTVTRFVLPGALATHQQAPHRVAGVVKGDAFVSLINQLFG